MGRLIPQTDCKKEMTCLLGSLCETKFALLDKDAYIYYIYYLISFKICCLLKLWGDKRVFGPKETKKPASKG